MSNEGVIANVQDSADPITLDGSAGLWQFDATDNPITVNLPPWSSVTPGWTYKLVKIDGSTNLVTINAYQYGPPDYTQETIAGGAEPGVQGSQFVTLGQAIPQIQDPDGPGTVPGVMSYNITANTAANITAGYPQWIVTGTSFAQ